MNECCDWHAITLNDKEDIVINNEKLQVYLSYCPECNNMFEYLNEKVYLVKDDRKNNYYNKYQNKLMLDNLKKYNKD